MTKMLMRLGFALVAAAASTAVSAQQVRFDRLQCVPLPEFSSPATTASCPGAAGGFVALESCRCPANFLLIQLNAPAAIAADGVSPS